jgi:hypothetical protein
LWAQFYKVHSRTDLYFREALPGCVAHDDGCLKVSSQHDHLKGLPVRLLRFSSATQLWKACEEGNLEGVQAVVNNTPQEERASLLGEDDRTDLVSL